MGPVGRCISWWELRRVPFNLVLAVTGLITIGVLAVIGDRLFPRGEDAIEPMALFLLVPLYAVAANIAYTVSWISELIWSGGDTTRTEAIRPRVFYLGLVFSIALTLAPAILIPAVWIILRIR
jgi:hypothetical protein